MVAARRRGDDRRRLGDGLRTCRRRVHERRARSRRPTTTANGSSTTPSSCSSTPGHDALRGPSRARSGAAAGPSTSTRPIRASAYDARSRPRPGDVVDLLPHSLRVLRSTPRRPVVRRVAPAGRAHHDQRRTPSSRCRTRRRGHLRRRRPEDPRRRRSGRRPESSRCSPTTDGRHPGGVVAPIHLDPTRPVMVSARPTDAELLVDGTSVEVTSRRRTASMLPSGLPVGCHPLRVEAGGHITESLGGGRTGCDARIRSLRAVIVPVRTGLCAVGARRASALVRAPRSTRSPARPTSVST